MRTTNQASCFSQCFFRSRRGRWEHEEDQDLIFREELCFMSFQKQFIYIISCRPAERLRDWFQQGSCPAQAKARFWSGSPWRALGILAAEK